MPETESTITAHTAQTPNSTEQQTGVTSNKPLEVPNSQQQNQTQQIEKQKNETKKPVFAEPKSKNPTSPDQLEQPIIKEKNQVSSVNQHKLTQQQNINPGKKSFPFNGRFYRENQQIRINEQQKRIEKINFKKTLPTFTVQGDTKTEYTFDKIDTDN